ncbi:GumC family protein [Primorskyibacter sp. 2E233]|uniref:GumC family protein n=1 Tax=Primorskyibacter sp. 2E233 TaxID=3413431 RepID=UPI003BF42FDE
MTTYQPSLFIDLTQTTENQSNFRLKAYPRLPTPEIHVTSRQEYFFMALEPKFYLRVFLSRFPLFMTVFILVVLAGFVVAITLPKVYKAQAALIVESSQIPDDLAASTVRVDLSQQLQIIQQRMMSRDNLLDLADQLDLFPDEPDLEPSQIIARLTDSIEMKLSGGRGAVTLLRITAESDVAETAARIADELVTRTLRQDADYRNEVASDTLSFFEKEVRRLGEELDYLNRRILEFQNENQDASPDTLNYRMNRLALLQERQTQVQRQIKQTEDERARLQKLYETTGRTENLNQRPLSPEEEELARLRSDLREARGVYSETNPNVTVIKRRISDLENLVAGRRPEADDQTPGEAVFNAQMSELDDQLTQLHQTLSSQEQEMEKLRSTIERTPTVSIRLNALERDRDNIQGQYNSAIERLSTAATGERIEVLSKGQRLSIVERPVVPTSTVNPSPKLIAAGSIMAALLMGIAAVLVIEVIQPFVRRPDDITKGLGIAPLASLPYIETPGEIWRRRVLRVMATVLIVAVGAGVLFMADSKFVQFDRFALKGMGQSQP